MEARDKNDEKSAFNKNYINEINGDWLVFKSLTILALIMFLALLGFFVWYVQ